MSALLEGNHSNVSEALRLLREDDENYEKRFCHFYTRSNHFDFVTDHVAIGGGVYSIQDARDIQAAGITHVVDCRIEDKAHVYWRKLPEVAYLWQGFDDDGRAKSSNVFARGIRFAINALDQGGVVLTHCAAGINRGPSMGYAVLRAYYGLRPAAAFKAIQAVRPCTGIIYAADVERALLDLGYEGG